MSQTALIIRDCWLFNHSLAGTLECICPAGKQSSVARLELDQDSGTVAGFSKGSLQQEEKCTGWKAYERQGQAKSSLEILLYASS